MTNQEKIFTLLALEGDCWHVIANPLKNGAEGRAEGRAQFADEEYCARCKLEYLQCRNALRNPELTTPDGVMWMLVRLPKWKRFEEFYNEITGTFIEKTPFPELDQDSIYIRSRILMNWSSGQVLTWLATDAKNGKSPALFNALCEYEGLGVEE